MRTVQKNDVCDKFLAAISKIENYVDKCDEVFSDNKLFLSYSYENAVIMLYREFENFILEILIYCLNHDHSNFERTYNIKLGKHINYDVCQYLITNGGYFDFKGRSNLSKVLNSLIGKEHNAAKTFKKTEYKDVLEQLFALRNYAAHNSSQSKKAALKAYNLQKIGSAGSCLKQQNRLDNMIKDIKALTIEIKGL